MPITGQLHTDHLPGRTLVVDGEEYLFFSGTSYLGIPHDMEFRACLLEGLERYGTNYSSSRHSNLKLQVFEEAEAQLAAWTGAEAALTMSSGYMAGQVVVQALAGSGHFIYAPGTHPALWRTMQEVGPVEKTYDDWVSQLLQKIHAVPEQHLILVCNSLDPLKALNHAFDWVGDLTRNKEITLIVDDSHGLGVTGEDGAGCFKQLKQFMPAIRLIVVGSMGKAMGIPAGVILSDNQTIEQLKGSPYYGGASPAVPAYLYAYLQGSNIFRQARQKLLQNIAYFRHQLQQPDLFSAFENYPVFSTSSEALCSFLIQNKIMISSFRYPTPADDPITRVVLSSLHTTEDLNRLTHCINQFEAEKI